MSNWKKLADILEDRVMVTTFPTLPHVIDPRAGSMNVQLSVELVETLITSGRVSTRRPPLGTDVLKVDSRDSVESVFIVSGVIYITVLHKRRNRGYPKYTICSAKTV